MWGDEGVKSFFDELFLGDSRMGIDLSGEIAELVQIYTDGLMHLDRKNEAALGSLVESMKRFIAVYDERNKIAGKLMALKSKVGLDKKDEEEDEDE